MLNFFTPDTFKLEALIIPATILMKEYVVFIADIIKTVGYFVIWPIDRFAAFITNLKNKWKKKGSKEKRKVSKKKPFVNTKKRKSRNRRRVQKAKRHKIVFHPGSFFMGGLIVIVFGFVPYEFYKWLRQLPNPSNLIAESIGNKSTKILDKDGRLLYEIYVDKKFAPVKLSQIPESVVRATIAVEDDNFYKHNGIRLGSIVRAGLKTFFEGEVQGGSTITQQLIKNVLLSPEQTISRKLKEAILSIIVETKYSKDQILEMYLNNIPYGGTSWGVQSASQKFFGKNVWELNLSESSLLAGLPSSPSRYSPLSDLDLAKERQKYVLNRMIDLHYITQEQADEAYAEELVFAEQTDYIQAPHFVDYVRRELEEKYGRRMVDFGGLTVITTLDLSLHREVQNTVTDGVIESAKYSITNGAAIVLDTETAGILAYVGSVDYFTEDWGAYDVITAYRQPGSSIKPLTYALALSSNYTAASVLKDAPVTYKIEGQPDYKPVNYDGKYHGDVTLRAALANSYNIPAVRLSKALGPDNIISLGRSMGLSNWEVDGSYGLSVTLGGKEVRLLDLANLYATLGRKGVYKKVSPFISIKDSKGYEIYWDTRVETRPVSEGVAYILWSILSDNTARTPAFGPRSSLYIPNYKVAVKTGTTDEKRDNWTLGFTPSYTVGVWVGNNNNDPMNRYLASGLSGAAPIWNEIIQKVLEGKPDEKLSMPENVFMKVDESCKPERSELFIKGSDIPRHLCVTQRDKDESAD
ncbi:PBP1A family penicillin-binding protein [Patescibacteria group bacterium]|nr:PBP1A family penicillin-binding protein [Patescibacteria group bacterium]